jgi:hypothetical protein
VLAYRDKVTVRTDTGFAGAGHELVSRRMASSGSRWTRFYDCLCSPLRAMSQMPDSVSDCLQSLPQRILPGIPVHCSLGRSHSVLLLRETTRLQPVGVG